MLRYAVLGNPIAHSLSPLIHAHFAQQLRIELSYERILVKGPFKAAADDFFAHGGRGCNVTLPCKLEACAYAHKLSAAAAAAGAVNTLKQEADGTVSGFNTDGPGLMLDLKRLQFPLQQARVLIIGAGGAVKGILLPLLQEQPAAVTVVNRTLSRAQTLADQHPGKVQALSFAELNAQSGLQFDLIINGSASSIQGTLPDVKPEILAAAQAAYDLMYTKAGTTIFTEHCRASGVQQTADGIGMLISQAALSFEIWQGVRPDIAETITYLTSVLKAQ